MNKNYVKTKNFHNTLHIYNAGMDNYLKWQKKGKNSSVFKYVKKIKKIKNKLIII